MTVLCGQNCGASVENLVTTHALCRMFQPHRDHCNPPQLIDKHGGDLKNYQEALDELNPAEASDYRSDVGTALYIAPGRFDIAYTVKLLAELIAKPNKLGQLRVKRLARYLKGTGDLALQFYYQEPEE
eukprot:1144110-Amphidinium_carterae.1